MTIGGTRGHVLWFRPVCRLKMRHLYDGLALFESPIVLFRPHGLSGWHKIALCSLSQERDPCWTLRLTHRFCAWDVSTIFAALKREILDDPGFFLQRIHTAIRVGHQPIWTYFFVDRGQVRTSISRCPWQPKQIKHAVLGPHTVHTFALPPAVLRPNKLNGC